MISSTRHATPLILMTLTAWLGACDPDDDAMGDVNATPGTITAPNTYTFSSRFEPDAQSVSYSGQTARHALIDGLHGYIANDLQMDAISNTAFTSKDDFAQALTFYYAFDSASNTDLSHTLKASTAAATPIPTAPSTYVGISADKDLKGKFAGNDAVTDHRDWSTAFAGWSDASFAPKNTSAEGVLLAMMDQLAAQAYDLSQGTAPKSPVDDATLPVYVTPEGRDLQQLIQKLLLVGITFSQTADDYLDDDVEGKGLRSPNTRDGDNTYSTLEHAWDEGFGYFGAARDYTSYTDAQIANGIAIDTDADGTILLTSEYNFGVSSNAAKRDVGSSTTAPTDFTRAIFEAFINGRTVIANAGDTLTDEELTQLKTHRDAAIENWEKVLAATAIHYINDTLAQMHAHTAATGDYDFATHAKVWSELKGFSLGFQFNPRSPMLTGTRFVDFHALIKDAPVLPTATAEEFAQYAKDLIAARSILKEAYSFQDANIGDEQGANGW